MKAMTVKIENALIYLGYAAGVILLLENMAKILTNSSEVGIRILVFSVFLWLASLISRKLVFRTGISILKTVQKLRLEFMYFVFCHTFTLLFVSTIMRYTPTGTGLGYYAPTAYEDYSWLMNFFTRDLMFFALINILGFMIFITLMLFSSKFFYKLLLQGTSVNTSYTHAQILRGLSFAIILIVAFGIINIPFVWNFLGVVNGKFGVYMKEHYQWLVDYVVGSPAFYYAFASFKGSELVEKFSLYRKVV